MGNFLLTQGEFVLRLVLACVCGGCIGYERKNRSKEAGVRTHLIVCLGSSLVMIVSKYGFFDLFFAHGISQDPARVAAQVVSGISFLGAGVIFTRTTGVSGLTTAAGIWATAAVGIAMGAGMYPIAIVTTLLILAAQFAFHKNTKWVRPPMSEKIAAVIAQNELASAQFQEKLSRLQIEVLSVKAKKLEDAQVELSLHISIPPEKGLFYSTALLEEAEITKVEF